MSSWSDCSSNATDCTSTSALLRAESALRAALREFEPDLVLCDFAMPGYSGRDAIHLIHRMDARLPVLVLSGSINEDVAVECLKSRAADCLAKQALARGAPAVRRALNEVIARKKYEARLQRMSNFDKLTGLPNAAQLSRRIELAIEQAQGLNRRIAVIALDIDGFGLLDSGFGRAASNAVLKAVGSKLRSIVSTKATVRTHRQRRVCGAAAQRAQSERRAGHRSQAAGCDLRTTTHRRAGAAHHGQRRRRELPERRTQR